MSSMKSTRIAVHPTFRSASMKPKPIAEGGMRFTFPPYGPTALFAHFIHELYNMSDNLSKLISKPKICRRVGILHRLESLCHRAIGRLANNPH